MGNRPDGSIIASDKWWNDKLGSNKVPYFQHVICIYNSLSMTYYNNVGFLCNAEKGRVGGPQEWLARFH
jgi:hypothetical protein